MGNWFWSQLFWCYCACVCIMCVRLAGRVGGWGGGVCVCVCVCYFRLRLFYSGQKTGRLGGWGACVCVCFIFAFAFSTADRKREPIPDDRTVSEKARYPWNFLRLVGMRTIHESADDRGDREGVYNGRRSAKYRGTEHSSFLPVLLNVLGCRLTF